MTATTLAVLLFAFQTAPYSPQTARIRVPTRTPVLVPAAYAVDFVSTAARGFDLNDFGTVIGTSYRDVGCGSFCLPPEDTVAWVGGVRVVLPALPGFSGITVRGVNRQGWIAGFAGFPGTATRAAVWIPSGGGYQIVDLGTLPGTNSSEAFGVDDQNRVVGWSTTTSFPPNGSPFVWTAGGGLVDLSAIGFPDEPPLAVSPGGTVATVTSWYRLGDPSSVVAMPTPPPGFTFNNGSIAVNDAGDQGRFLVSTSSQSLRYLFRFHHEGTWQQLSASPTGHLSTYGIGSIDAQRTVTATVQSAGVIAYGPMGTAQSLASLLSPVYLGGDVTSGGPIDASGRILARVMIGRSSRLVRLVPVSACGSPCATIAYVDVQASFVPDPTDPTQDHCAPTLTAHNTAVAIVEVRDPAGNALAGATVAGRFLDDYWTDAPAVQTTNASGIATFSFTGPCGVGAIAFLVDGVSAPGFAFDRTAGEWTDWQIPQ